MSERKGEFSESLQVAGINPILVLNKYFPPDFDPELIPRRKQPKNAQQVVRLMAPFSMSVSINDPTFYPHACP
jgi:hypothetical protein